MDATKKFCPQNPSYQPGIQTEVKTVFKYDTNATVAVKNSVCNSSPNRL